MTQGIGRRMRPIYWGLALTFTGIFLTILLGLVYNIVFLEKYPNGGIVDTSGNSYYVNIPPIYDALYNFVKFTFFLGLPIAIAIEAYHYLKRRRKAK